MNLQINPTHIKRGMGYIVGSHLSSFKKDGPGFPWIAEDVTKVEIEGESGRKKWFPSSRKEFPGSNCYLMDVSTSVGPRIPGEL